MVLLMPLIAIAQTTNEVKYHQYKTYAHDASDVKWAAGQSIREYLATFSFDFDSLETGLDAHIDNVSNPHQVTATQVTASTIEVSDSTTVQLLLNDIGLSMYNQKFSGFVSWYGTGDYWQVTGGAIELLRGGEGYIYGRRVIWSAPQTTAVLAANTECYVYIDRNGVIQTTDDQPTAFNAIPLFEVLYDGTNYTVVKENHSYTFPTRASEYIHNNIGIIIRNAAGGANIDKLGTTTGADVADRQVELLGADVLEDHGLETTIPDSTGAAITINYYYTDGSGKWIRYDSTTEVPMFYNNAGTPTALTTNYYGNYRLYVTKDNLNSTTPVYIGVMDDGNYANAILASNAITAGMPKATNELAGLELAQLGYITVRNATGGYITVVDVEKSTLNGETTGSGASNIAALISTNAFDGILSGALNVQVALDIIDNWTILADMDSAEAVIEAIHITDDSQDVAINGIITGSGFATTAQVSQEVLVHNEAAGVHANMFADYYTSAQTNATIEAAIAAISTPAGANITLEATAAETLAAGDFVSLINTADVITAKKTDNTNVAGVCQGAYDTSESAIILIKGTDANQSGLITGANYYRQADYSIGTTPVSIDGNYIFVGYSKSATQIILD
jgi:hypothetical protein